MPSIGQRIERQGLQQSVGMMVNYLYDLDSIEENHDAYFDQGEVAISRAAVGLLNRVFCWSLLSVLKGI